MRSSTDVSRVVTFVGCLMVPAVANAQEPLQFNVPYSCQDGVTRIISRCEKNARGGEVCFWREGQNGQFDSERYNVRAQMDGWLAMCKPLPAQPAATPRPAAPSAAPAPSANRPALPTNSANVAGTPSPKIPNDPGTVKMRRCLELGGETAECLGSGLQTGLLDLAGFGGNPLAKVFTDGENPLGVRIGGTFATAGGLTLTFDSVNVNISSCGKLEPATRPYTVTKRGNQLQVEISNEPKPLGVLLGPNNVFTGPAAFPITGQIITGYESRYVEQRRVSDNSVVVGSGRFERVPMYETRTVSCGFSSLRASTPVREEGTVIGSLAGAVGVGAAQSATSQAPAGARMGGTYAGANGVKVEFRATAAILDCGNAHVKKPYDVQNLADRVVITVRNDNAQVTLTLRPDGALAGSGAVVVAGRLVTSMSDSGVATFAPHQERCALSTLTAQAQ
jgi:hypothetical protein